MIRGISYARDLSMNKFDVSAHNRNILVTHGSFTYIVILEFNITHIFTL